MKKIMALVIAAVFSLTQFPLAAHAAERVEIIVDNSDRGFTSDSPWTVSTLTAGFYGKDYLNDGDDEASPDKWAKWTPDIKIPGEYNVYLKYSGGAHAQSGEVPIEIKYDGGIDKEKKADMNSTELNQKWVFMGNYKFAAGKSGYLKVSAAAKGRTVADAVKFVLASTDSPEDKNVIPLMKKELVDGIVEQETKVNEEVTKPEVIPASLSVDENTVIRKASRSLLGYNYEWYEGMSVLESDAPDKLGVSEDLLKLLNDFELPMPYNRYAGTTSQFFQWKLSLGDAGSRTPHQLVNYNKSAVFPSFGMIEMLNSILKVDKNGQFVIVLNFDKETPEDYADLAEFLLGDGKTNINGGRDWAKKRIELGIQDPVKVYIWELGNEMDWGSFRAKFPVEKYIQTCKEAIKAIKSVDPNAKFSAHAATGPWGSAVVKVPGYDDWRGWHKSILKEIADEIDFITLHPYYLGMPINEVEQYINDIAEDIKTITNSDRIKVFASEHSTWPSNLDNKATWPESHALQGIIGVTQFYSRLFNNNVVEAAMYHAFTGGPWGIVYRTNGKRYMTGIAELFKLLNHSLGTDVVKTTLTGDYTDTSKSDNTLTAYTMTTERGLNIVMANREKDSKRQLQFHFANNYKLVSETIITGDKMMAVNSADKKEISVTTNEKKEEGVFSEYQMPSKSVVVVYLEKLDRPVEDGLKSKMKNTISLKIGSPNAYVNGELKKVDKDNEQVTPVIMETRTFVPLRFVSENMGAEVVWDEATSTVTITKDQNVIRIAPDSEKYFINNREEKLDVPAQFVNDRVFIPLRAVSEAFGKKIFWHDKGLIIIRDKEGLFDPETEEAVDEVLRLFP